LSIEGFLGILTAKPTKPFGLCFKFTSNLMNSGMAVESRRHVPAPKTFE
jgi:hypothetical protein